MLKGLAKKAYGNAVVVRHLRGQTRVPYLPAEQWQTMRDRRVRAIVRHAAATVPYYRDLFRAERIDPQDIRSAADLDRLPIVDKHTVWQAPERFLSESFNARNALPLITSGSTGKPLTVYHDHGSLLANIAYGERERPVIARLTGKGVRWKEAMLLYAGSTFGKVLAFYQQATFIPLRPGRIFLSISDSIDTVVETLNRFEPDVVVGYSGYVEMLFRTVAARSMPLHRPRLVIFGGEAMTPAGREFITERFNVRLTALYNAVEAFKIGFACEAGSDYHLHADLCHVRIVDGCGRTLPAGEQGEVVISNLVNRATVLLNYRLGDMAARSNRQCSCGRTLPLLSELEGRVEDIIRLAGNAFVHPLSVWGIFKGKPEVLRYQVVQHALDRFSLRLATIDEASYQQVLPAVVRELRALVGEAAIIESHRQPELAAEGATKFRAVVSEWQADR